MTEEIDFSEFAKDNKAFIKEHEIKFVPYRYHDLSGKSHDLDTYGKGNIYEEDGKKLKALSLDGSSIPGFSVPEKSGLMLSPGDRAYIDDSGEHKALVVYSHVTTLDGELFEKAPRTALHKAIEHLNEKGFTAHFGQEPEYFLKKNPEGVENFSDLPAFTDKDKKNDRYHASEFGKVRDLNREVVTQLNELAGVESNFHHKEVAKDQHEAEVSVATAMDAADNVSILKAILRAVSLDREYISTFSPKPIPEINGSGMHTNMSISDESGKNLFAGDEINTLSETAKHAIGGIMKHAKALQAFANPTEESYDRLVPELEAPVSNAFGPNNRTVAVRIPDVTSPKASRIEARFPDPSGSVHLLLAAVQMAALDGIENKIDPGKPVEADVFKMTPEARKSAGIEELNTNTYDDSGKLTKRDGLEKSLKSLENDNAFLLKGGVFTENLIETYIEVTRKKAVLDNKEREAREEEIEPKKQTLAEKIMNPEKPGEVSHLSGGRH